MTRESAELSAQPYKETTRDRLAWRLANGALLLATPRYRAFVRGAVLLGLAAAEDAAKEAKR